VRMAVAHAQNPISPESGALAAVCLLDTFSSALLFALGMAVEANPLLRPVVEAGLAPFVLLKCTGLLTTVAYLEWVRQSRPRFAVGLLRCGVAGYLALYLLGTAVQFRG
jgi:hypothetical protein